VLTVILLCTGLALSFTMLVKADLGPMCGLAATWHEYIAFAVSTQALAVGLSTLVWLMLVEVVDRDEPGSRLSDRVDWGRHLLEQIVEDHPLVAVPVAEDLRAEQEEHPPALQGHRG